MPTAPAGPVAPAPEAVPEQPVIYGGANPAVTNVQIEQDNTPHQIYGGANPLENTQSIPIATITQSAVQPQPVAEPTMISPTIAPEPAAVAPAAPAPEPVVAQPEVVAPAPVAPAPAAVTPVEPAAVTPVIEPIQQ